MVNDLKFKVLSLKPVSRKNDYFHVNLDNGDKYNFHRNSISQYNIKENQLIENKVIHKALDHTERENIKCKIIVLFSYRQRSKKELKDTFVSKGYKIENVLSVIDELEQRKYINDELFTKMMATNLIKEKKFGRYLVEQKLFQHGIDFSVMDPIISSLYKKYPQSKTIKEILNKRNISKRDSLKNKIKTINHLKRKGFHFEDINTIIDAY
tara:strand:- start:261 stop:890 length:630 start_codon:yes stop_codon:yes gene_type:complete